MAGARFSYRRSRKPSQKAKASQSERSETPDKQNATFEAGNFESNCRLSDKDPDYPSMVLANYMLVRHNYGARAQSASSSKEEPEGYGISTRFRAPRGRQPCHVQRQCHQQSEELTQSGGELYG